MRKRIVGVFILLAAASLVCVSAGAEDILIRTSGGSAPFLYEGYTYMPVQNVTKFLGADLGWDPNKGQAVMTYQGQQFALTPGKTNATFGGQNVVLASPPVVINGRTYVSTETFKKYYKVPMQYYPNTSQVRILGPNGWGTTTVKNRAPWHGGPPPWAPAWGQRGRQLGYWVDSDKPDKRKGNWKLKDKSDHSGWQQLHDVTAKSKKHEQGKGQSKHKGKGQGKNKD